MKVKKHASHIDGPMTLSQAKTLGLTDVVLDEYRKYVGMTNQLSFEHKKVGQQLLNAEQELNDLEVHKKYLEHKIAEQQIIVDKLKDRRRIVGADLEIARMERKLVAKDESVAKKMDTLLQMERDIRVLRRKLSHEHIVVLKTTRTISVDAVDTTEVVSLVRHELPMLTADDILEITHLEPDSHTKETIAKREWAPLFNCPIEELG